MESEPIAAMFAVRPLSERTRVPSCRLHKTSGRAVIRLNGRDIYLGKYGAPESEAKYNRVISEWLNTHGRLVTDDREPIPSDITLNEVAR